MIDVTLLRSQHFVLPTNHFAPLHLSMRLPIYILLVWAAMINGCTTPPQKVVYRPDWLSPTSKIVFTSRWEDGFLGDATFKLKATATMIEFASAVKQLGLTPYRDVPKFTYSNEPPQWDRDSDTRWDVGTELDDSFILKQGRWWQLAKYRNGFLYYQSVRY